MTEDELLQRIARTLKQEIGPAVDAEYPKTQAFMAAVVVQKLGRQLGLAGEHAAAEGDDLDRLISDLNVALAAGGVPTIVTDAIAELERARDKPALCCVIEALYSARGELTEPRFTQLLGRIRTTLRASIDRRVEYAA